MMSDLDKQQPQASYGRPQHQTEPATGSERDSAYERQSSETGSASLEEEE